MTSFASTYLLCVQLISHFSIQKHTSASKPFLFSRYWNYVSVRVVHKESSTRSSPIIVFEVIWSYIYKFSIYWAVVATLSEFFSQLPTFCNAYNSSLTWLLSHSYSCDFQLLGCLKQPNSKTECNETSLHPSGHPHPDSHIIYTSMRGRFSFQLLNIAPTPVKVLQIPRQDLFEDLFAVYSISTTQSYDQVRLASTQ